jgi:hypothetical protein
MSGGRKRRVFTEIDLVDLDAPIDDDYGFTEREIREAFRHPENAPHSPRRREVVEWLRANRAEAQVERLREAQRKIEAAIKEYDYDRISDDQLIDAIETALHPAGDPSDSRGGERSSPADEEQG